MKQEQYVTNIPSESGEELKVRSELKIEVPDIAEVVAQGQVYVCPCGERFDVSDISCTTARYYHAAGRGKVI